MQITKDLYGGVSLALLTDLYQLTMAYGYWKAGRHNDQAVFHLFFRKNPFSNGYTIACGLEYAIDYLKNLSFTQQDVDYLAGLKGNDGKALFEQGFLDYLKELRFTCDIDAVPEGTVVFPQQPLVRVTGSLIEAQLIETPLLNMINFQSLIATKASRMFLAAEGKNVLEFGLRRAQGIDGSLAASRAAYIGGCDATSNVLAGRLFDIPVKGTHAHSWVMSFDDELEAFNAYAEAMPNNCIFLVDTYDTTEGVKKAIEAGKILRKKGYEMLGIRLDSGDLAYLSSKARKLLDDAGFENAQIVASNDLDEHIISSLKAQDAKIDVWGIGTKLVTSYDQPALGGVYKLAALKDENGNWKYKIKLSEQAIKISNPGILQTRRFFENGLAVADMIFDQENFDSQSIIIIDPLDGTRQKKIGDTTSFRDLLVPIFRKGELIYQMPNIKDTKKFVISELDTLHRSIKRFTNPHQYPVGLDKKLYDLKTELILNLRHIKD